MTLVSKIFYRQGDEGALLAKLRDQGWYVAVHNDYVINVPNNADPNADDVPQRKTFWLFTNPNTQRFVRGEGDTDIEALNKCYSQTSLTEVQHVVDVIDAANEAAKKEREQTVKWLRENAKYNENLGDNPERRIDGAADVIEEGGHWK